MTLSDFTSHAEAQAYTETKTRMISPDMMVAFMATFGILRAVQAEDGEAAEALRVALQFGSEFNLIIDHPASVEPLLSQITAATTAFKNYCKGYANSVINPFAKTTLADFDKAKLTVSPSLNEATYASAASYFNHGGIQQVHVASVVITEALLHDDIFYAYLSTKNEGETLYGKNNVQRGYVRVKAGEIGKFDITLNKTGGIKKQVKCFVQSKYQRNFNVSVAIAES